MLYGLHVFNFCKCFMCTLKEYGVAIVGYSILDWLLRLSLLIVLFKSFVSSLNFFWPVL